MENTRQCPYFKRFFPPEGFSTNKAAKRCNLCLAPLRATYQRRKDELNEYSRYKYHNIKENEPERYKLMCQKSKDKLKERNDKLMQLKETEPEKYDSYMQHRREKIMHQGKSIDRKKETND